MIEQTQEVKPLMDALQVANKRIQEIDDIISGMQPKPKEGVKPSATKLATVTVLESNDLIDDFIQKQKTEMETEIKSLRAERSTDNKICRRAGPDG